MDLTYPASKAPQSEWLEWGNQVAPFGRPCHPELHHDLRFLCGVQMRELAASAAQGTVNALRRIKELDVGQRRAE